ncbi:hypothetical protein BK752_17210 [Bacillus thuringiensis serovar canadensis]|nr:hypothetical protein BK752_17210 [Bacillus thuringiensis serovar canadensis]OXL96049.1 hypothetical protein B6N65_19430 [Bacillus sp. KbaB1]PCC78116.1 hypothetical protein CNQ76_18520 [Bacillus cereus]PDR73363.1 hypothetical protein CNQ81_30110 [Bacillus cereus]PDR80511.1 hypothetical protein CNQ79_22945 [Bacillus cereus]
MIKKIINYIFLSQEIHRYLLFIKWDILSRYLPGSKTPPQNSAEAKKLGGESTARKSPVSEG